jgi:hypothetical protein
MKNTVFWDVTLVTANVSEERIASINRVTRIGELETTLAVTGNRRTLREMNQTASHPRRRHSSLMKLQPKCEMASGLSVIYCTLTIRQPNLTY